MKINLSLAKNIYNRIIHIILSIVIFLVTLTPLMSAIPKLDLRSMENFVVLAGSTVTGIPLVSMTGNVGLSPAAGSYIVGFDGSNVSGILYVVDASGPAGSTINPTLLQTAKSDLTIAYGDAAGRTPVPTGSFLNPGSGNIGGLNLVAGLYKFTSDAAITGSDLTLTGSATDVWIFQIASSLNLGSNIKVILAGGAQATNIFWQVGTSATLGTYSAFKGTILADQSISLGTGASIDGRALAFSAAVTMASGVKATKPELKFPILYINTNQIAFGNVIKGLSKKDSVTITNNGTANLVINSITTSNNVFTITPINSTILPGASKKFYITFSPNVDGIANGQITFNHNAENSKTIVTLTGNSVSSKYVISPKILNFGNVTNGSTKKDSVLVTNTGSANLVISSIISTNFSFAVTPFKSTISPGSSQKIYVMFTPITSVYKEGNIIFIFNSTNTIDTVKVSGTGVGSNVSPIFLSNRKSINFGDVNSGSSKQDSIIITNTGTANLIIAGALSNNVNFKIGPSNSLIGLNESQKFYITFNPLTPGLQQGYIYFYHNAANSKDSIQISGTGIGSNLAPIFSIISKNIDFGKVFIQTSKQMSFQVKNTGTSDLDIYDIFTSNGDFSITPIVESIKSGSSAEFFVTFSPTMVGTYNSNVQFIHNAGYDTLFITGIGVDSIKVISIRDARNLPLGTDFAIEGIVTRALGSYTRIQDQTGAITIFQESGSFYNEVLYNDIQMADRIRVQGRISEIDFLKVIQGDGLTGYRRLSRLNVIPNPVKVSLTDLKSNAEQYESQLITLDNLNLTKNENEYFIENTTYQISDKNDNTNFTSIRIGNGDDTEIDGSPFIGYPVIFEGILSQSSKVGPSMGYQLTPVWSSDLSIGETDVNSDDNSITNALVGNYPNPFNSSTTIRYRNEKSAFVSLKVYDLLGNEVAILVNSYQEAGIHNIPFMVEYSDYPVVSKLYFYRLSIGDFSTIKSMIFIK